MHHIQANQRPPSVDSSNDASQQQEISKQTDIMNRPFDVVIFAASGSVGKFLVEELALVVDKYYSNNKAASSPQPPATPSGANNNNGNGNTHGSSLTLRDPNQFAQQTYSRRRSVPRQVDGIKWAVAGRSAVKLSEALCRAEIGTGIRDLSTQIPVLLADLNHRKSLLDMCQKTRLVINCAGPYSELNAECLINVCLESQTNYLDLAHESTFIELIRKKYSQEARERGVFIINGCGFQAMSAEMGLNFTKQVADGQVDEIKIILSLSDTKAHLKTTNSSTSPSSRSILSTISSSWCATAAAAAAATTTTRNIINNCGTVSLGMWLSLIGDKSREVSVERQRVKQESNRQQQHQRRQKFILSNRSKESAPDADSPSSIQEETTAGLLAESQGSDSSTDRPPPKNSKILERKDTQSLVRDIVQFRNKNSLAWLQLFQGFTQNGRGYCCPVDDLISDEAQLIRGEMSNYELRRPDLNSPTGWRPIRCSSFVSMKSLVEICFAFVWILVFKLLVKWAPFRLMMRNFPTICSLGFVNGQQYELDRDSLSHMKFCQTFIAYGTPSDDSGDPLERRDRDQMRRQVQLLVARIVGPEPNYIATATYAIQAALALCLERDHLPCRGGVLTPGVAFSETNIIYQLRRRNIKFEVLKKA